MSDASIPCVLLQKTVIRLCETPHRPGLFLAFFTLSCTENWLRLGKEQIKFVFSHNLHYLCGAF